MLKPKKTEKFLKEYHPLLSLQDKELEEIKELIGTGPRFYPVWQTPLALEETMPLSISFSPDGRVFASTERDKIKVMGSGGRGFESHTS